MERPADARLHFVEARAMSLELFGRDDVRYVGSTGSVGVVLADLGQFQEAEGLLFEALGTLS